MSIYELLNQIIVDKKYTLLSSLFTDADKKKLPEEERYIFDLVKNISSLGMKIDNNGIEFHPMLVMADGRRAFSIEDISEDDYLKLQNLELEKLPLILRARIADILWVNKKEFVAAKIAANTYWKLFILWYEANENIASLDMIRRAVCISVQTKQDTLYNEIQEWLNNFIKSNTASSDGFFLLRIIELFFYQKGFDVSIFLKVLDDLINDSDNNVIKVEQAYELKIQCLSKLKRNDEAKQNKIMWANYYVDFAEKIFQNNIQDALRAVNYYQKGIMLYRDNGETQKAENTHRRKLINAEGQTVLVLPPLDIHNPEKNLKFLELHMYQNALEQQKILGDIWIKNALSLLREKFVIDDSKMKFLVKDNLIIPDGRERIFQSGLYMFINGDYYEAIHILAPQVEKLFRNIAREVGGLTITLESDGSSLEKVLSSVFSLPEMLDCYDNDILFTFRGLLNERAGANIRNEIAHGIMDEYTCSTGACLYFGVAVIKLLSLTSHSCYQIFKNSEKLKHFEMPSKDAFKVIR